MLGLIAVAGVAAETGIVMVVYLDEAFERYLREGRIHTPADVDAARGHTDAKGAVGRRHS